MKRHDLFFFGHASPKISKKMSFRANSLRFHNFLRYTIRNMYEVNGMRIAICDDDILIIEQLKCYIKTFFESKKYKVP